MGKPNQRHVVRAGEDAWAVKKPHAQRASALADTQAKAEARAKEILLRQGGGEAVIHRRDGRIRDSDTVKPGNDPFPPRDARH